MLTHTLHDTLQKYSLIPDTATCIVAVSGGVDSIVLLHALLFLQNRKLFNSTLHVATLNHGLRDDAAGDVEFVQRLCDLWDIACTTGAVDTATFATHNKLSIEAAARRLRYDFLADVAEQQNTNCIMTAHHQDDLVETIVMHLIRGSGIQGLQGMTHKAPVPGHPALTLYRPMLDISRADIEAYRLEHQLTFRDDETNIDTRFTRNRLRHNLVPMLKTFNPQVDAALLQFAEIASTEHDYLQQQFQREILPQLNFQSAYVSIPRQMFTTAHLALQRYTLIYILQQIASESEVTFKHIQAAINLSISGSVGAIAEFPDGYYLYVDYERLLVLHRDNALPQDDFILLDADALPLNLKIPMQVDLPTHTLHFSHHPDEIPCLEDEYSILTIPSEAEFMLRPRQPGDRIMLPGMNGQSRKLKNWMIDHKIPRYLRDNIPLLIIDNVIMAIILPEKWLILHNFNVTKRLEIIVYCCAVKNQ